MNKNLTKEQMKSIIQKLLSPKQICEQQLFMTANTTTAYFFYKKMTNNADDKQFWFSYLHYLTKLIHARK